MAMIKNKKLVLIASSTGGPNALNKLIPQLKGNLDAPVVIVQHIPKGFTHSLAKRLNEISEIEVSEAYHDHILEKGHVYIARGGSHLLVKQKYNGDLYFCEDDSEPVCGLKPYANITFESVSHLSVAFICCVIMTGMGSDGCLGLQTLKNKQNIYTIAQSKESCVVYGMPKVVVEQGLVDNILPLDKIGNEINKKVGVS